MLPENQPRKPKVGEDREGGGSTLCPWIDSELTAHNPVKILILIYPGGAAAAAEIKTLRSNKRQAADKVGRPLIKPHSAKVSQCLAISEPPPGLWPQESDALGACGEGQQPGRHRGREEEAASLRSTPPVWWPGVRRNHLPPSPPPMGLSKTIVIKSQPS